MDNGVSVILPYKDRADVLQRAIRSVLAQTHDDITLILIDDASTDGSADIAMRHNGARIVHASSKEGLGPSAARNVGLRLAETNLVAFIDSDDEWMPRKLEVQVRALRSLQSNGFAVSVVGCGWTLAGREDSTRHFCPGPFTRDDVLLRGVPGTGTPLLLVDRLQAASDPQFDPSLPALEDRDFVIDCLRNGSKVLVTPEILAVVARGRSDHAARPLNAAIAYDRLLDKYAVELKEADQVRSWYQFRACREWILAGERRRSLRYAPKALETQRLRRLTHILFGLAGGQRGLAFAQKVAPL